MLSKDNNVLIVGDFNCKEINRQEGTFQGGEYSWSEKLMSWALENLLTQWINCEMRISGRGTSSRLDLSLTTDGEAIKEIEYKCPLGKSHHVLMEISLGKDSEIIDEEYKMERYRYSKAKFEDMRKYFEGANWSYFEDKKGIQGKWDEFVKVYNEAVEKHVPKGRRNCTKEKEWHNGRCKRLKKKKKKKTRVWNRWNKVRTERRWKGLLKLEMNE